MHKRKNRSLPPNIEAWKQQRQKLSSTSQRWRRRAASLLKFILGCIFFLLWLNGDNIPSLSTHTTPALADWEWRREEVKQAFISSWDAYEKYAFGTTLER
jgi:mannosyl-oligosaccharide alpha-1,2-mannosidase